MSKATFKTVHGAVELPSKFILCDSCQGTGTELGGSLKGMAFSPEEMDQEFREDYFGGSYDVPCSECHGLRVTPGFDVARMTFAEKRQAVLVRQHRRYQERKQSAHRRWVEQGGYGDFDY